MDDIVAGLLGQPGFDWQAMRRDLIADFRKTASETDRIWIIRSHRALMELVAGRAEGPERQAAALQSWEDYNRFLVLEAFGSSGVFSALTLLVVTSREIDAGRMDPDDELHATGAFLLRREPASNYPEQVRIMLGNLLPEDATMDPSKRLLLVAGPCFASGRDRADR